MTRETWWSIPARPYRIYTQRQENGVHIIICIAFRWGVNVTQYYILLLITTEPLVKNSVPKEPNDPLDDCRLPYWYDHPYTASCLSTHVREHITRSDSRSDNSVWMTNQSVTIHLVHVVPLLIKQEERICIEVHGRKWTSRPYIYITPVYFAKHSETVVGSVYVWRDKETNSVGPIGKLHFIFNCYYHSRSVNGPKNNTEFIHY